MRSTAHSSADEACVAAFTHASSSAVPLSRACLFVIARGGPIVINLTVTSLTLCNKDSSLPCYGFAALVRISFSLCCFFLIHLILPLISRFNWWLKGALLVAVTVGCWFIPDTFYTVYVDIARFFSGAFLLIQLIILVDFAYTWQEQWTSDERPMHKYVLAISAAMFGGSITLIGFLYHWFASSSCHVETFLITFALILCVGFSLLSVSPWIEGGGLLPAAVVTSYSVYLLFSALGSDPSKECNRLYGAGGSLTNSHANIWQTVVNCVISGASVAYAAYNIYTSGSLIGEEDSAAAADDAESYSSMGDSKSAAAPATADMESGHADAPSQQADHQANSSEIVSVTNKQYRRFYLVMAVTSMYLCMLLTNWGNRQSVDDAGHADETTSKENLWVKVVTQWAVAGVYIWSLVAPLVLRDRDFS